MFIENPVDIGGDPVPTLSLNYREELRPESKKEK